MSNRWLLIMLVIMMLQPSEGGCIDEERKALLDIKFSLINSYYSESEDPLPTWIDHGNVSKCCNWERVKCNTITGHVTVISLSHLRNNSDQLWPLNVSLFLHFDELTSLNLSHSRIDGGIMKTGLKSLSSLKKLEILDLSWNYHIDNGTLLSLSALTSLISLNLSRTRMNAYFPANEFAALENLEMLDLSFSGFYGTFQIQCNIYDMPATGFERVSILKKLETLNLAGNEFNDSVITSLSVLPSLKALDLHDNPLSGSFPAQELSHLTNLEELNLSSTKLNGTPNVQACKSLSTLRRLENITLSDNDFNKGIISCLSALPSLKILDLSNSFSWGSSFPVQDFPNLRNLEILLLGDNGFNGTLPDEAFTSFHHLEVLDLSDNSFVGSIPSAIQALSSLRIVSFANNELNGSLLEHGFCESKNLQEFDLSNNMLYGSLPQCFNGLSSLKVFDISSNQFTGVFVSSHIASLTSLEFIDFRHNKFEGSFSFSSFSNHTNLKEVRFRSDNDKFVVETEEPRNWNPMFQLEVLELSNCNINMLNERVVPSFLLTQNKLRVVDLSHNLLKGQLPNWLIKNNTHMEVLSLRNNSFGSIISMPLYTNANMQELDMSGNHLIGTIPDDVKKFFPNMYYLNLSRNALSGEISTSMGDLSELRALDLSDNELSGEVPKQLFTNLSQLNILKLSNNRLHGEVLARNLSLVYIEGVHLDGNQFTGKINGFKSKEKFEYLSVLDISNNYFTGMIPDWISNMSWLSQFVARNNSFEGQFPCGTAPFSFLDISQNSFSGFIPSCLNLKKLAHLHLGSNRFTGSIPDYFRNLTNVLTFDIGNNNVSGKIPKFLGELSNLRILILRKNNFSGSIPKQLCQLSNVSLIDLSYNSLSGSIPSCLQNITGPSHLAFKPQGLMTYPFISFSMGDDRDQLLELQDEVQFTTKSLSLPYKGGVLDIMSGLDLSCNKLTGEIPQELGSLSQIRALNLSHNELRGPIPINLSNLANIESLDLSSNGLTGKVPSELMKLNSLAVFNVSHNNLSGRLPEMKAQFGTFTKASYEGNPLLCGPPLEKQCTTESQVPDPSAEEEDNEKWYDVDMTSFYASSGSTCGVFLLGYAALLYMNTYWRKRWLDLVEECMLTCYYFFYRLVRKASMIFHK